MPSGPFVFVPKNSYFYDRKVEERCYKKKWPLVVFLVPGLLFMLVFLYIPFVQNIRTAFYDMTAIIEMPGTEWKFIGFENYKKLFTDPDVRTALINS